MWSRRRYHDAPAGRLAKCREPSTARCSESCGITSGLPWATYRRKSSGARQRGRYDARLRMYPHRLGNQFQQPRPDMVSEEYLDLNDLSIQYIHDQNPMVWGEGKRVVTRPPGSHRRWCSIKCGAEIVPASAPVDDPQVMHLTRELCFALAAKQRFHLNCQIWQRLAQQRFVRLSRHRRTFLWNSEGMYGPYARSLNRSTAASIRVLGGMPGIDQWPEADIREERVPLKPPGDVATILLRC